MNSQTEDTRDRAVKAMRSWWLLPVAIFQAILLSYMWDWTIVPTFHVANMQWHVMFPVLVFGRWFFDVDWFDQLDAIPSVTSDMTEVETEETIEQSAKIIATVFSHQVFMPLLSFGATSFFHHFVK